MRMASSPGSRSAGAGRFAPGSTPWPTGGAADVRAGGPSRPRPAQPQRPRPGWQLRQTGAPAHTSAGPRWSQAWPSSGVGPPARHATARCWPDTPAHRCAWRRCGATRARSWTPHAPAGERSPVCPGPVRDTARSPRVQRTPDTAPMAASLMAQVSSVACRPPPGTSGPPPRATRRPLSPRPRSTDPPQSPPRTAAGSPAAPRLVGQATPATRLVAPDLSAVSQPSSQPPPSRCCDDPLNPPCSPHGMQEFLSRVHWDADALRDDLRAYVVEQLGDADAVLVLDETGFLKKGTKSAGVHRQYSGTAGRIENCQIGVFLAYASRHGHALIDRALYLPQTWTDDPSRCRNAGIPDEVTFTPKPKIGRAMLERALAAHLPFAWVTGDSVYGADSALRRSIEAASKGSVLTVPSAQHLGLRPVGDWATEVPKGGWTRLSAGDGAKGASPV